MRESLEKDGLVEVCEFGKTLGASEEGADKFSVEHRLIEDVVESVLHVENCCYCFISNLAYPVAQFGSLSGKLLTGSLHWKNYIFISVVVFSL